MKTTADFYQLKINVLKNISADTSKVDKTSREIGALYLKTICVSYFRCDDKLFRVNDK